MGTLRPITGAEGLLVTQGFVMEAIELGQYPVWGHPHEATLPCTKEGALPRSRAGWWPRGQADLSPILPLLLTWGMTSSLSLSLLFCGSGLSHSEDRTRSSVFPWKAAVAPHSPLDTTPRPRTIRGASGRRSGSVNAFHGSQICGIDPFKQGPK